MRAEVQKPDFLDGNFLSNEERIPIDVVQTNAARALATNATRGHVWDNFSSETYKTLPAAGEIDVEDAFDHSQAQVLCSGRRAGILPCAVADWNMGDGAVPA